MTTDNRPRFKEMVRDQWTFAAEAWRSWHPQFTQMTRAATEAIIDAAQLAPGMQVLDLAGGTGEPSITAAERVAPGGTVVCTDFIPAMVATAEENAHAAGLTNMRFQQVDAEAIPFPDASFDRVTSRFGVMFFPHVDKALAEIRRALRDGGRAAFIVWAPADQNLFFSSANGVLARRGLVKPPEPGAPTPFTFAEPGSLSVVLTQAGFRQVNEQRRELPWSWPGTPEQYWEFMRATLPAMREALEAKDAAEVADVEREIFASLGQHYDGSAINFGAKVYVVTAVR